jgi:deoxyxylulose-5-phosphate synthase
MLTYKLKPGFNHYDYRDAVDPDTGEKVVVEGKPVRERYKLKAGDTIQMSEERFISANLKDRFALVSGGSNMSAAANTTSESTSETEIVPVIDWSFVKTMKQAEVLDLISNTEDMSTAAAIYEAEESGKNREKVLEAAKLKYQELGGSTE